MCRGSGGVANGAPVAHERVAEGPGAKADGMRERDDGPLLAGSMEVVDEGRVHGDEGTRGDVESVLERNDGSELGRDDDVRHRRRGPGRRGSRPARSSFYDLAG